MKSEENKKGTTIGEIIKVKDKETYDKLMKIANGEKNKR